jgi:hypothetical protein
VFICVKNYIACMGLWLEEDFEMITVEVKNRDPKFTCGNRRHLQSSERGHESYRKII